MKAKFAVTSSSLDNVRTPVFKSSDKEFGMSRLPALIKELEVLTQGQELQENSERFLDQITRVLNHIGMLIDGGTYSMPSGIAAQLQPSLRELVSGIYASVFLLSFDCSANQEKVQLAALLTLEKVVTAVPKHFTAFWIKFLPVTEQEPSLLHMFWQSAPLKQAALSVLCAMLKDSKPFLAMANQFERKAGTNFTSLSQMLSAILTDVQRALVSCLVEGFDQSSKNGTKSLGLDSSILLLSVAHQFLANCPFVKLDASLLQGLLEPLSVYLNHPNAAVQSRAALTLVAYVEACAYRLSSGISGDSHSLMSTLSSFHSGSALFSDAASGSSQIPCLEYEELARHLSAVLCGKRELDTDFLSLLFLKVSSHPSDERSDPNALKLLATLTKYFFRTVEGYRENIESLILQGLNTAELCEFLCEYLNGCRVYNVPQLAFQVPLKVLDNCFRVQYERANEATLLPLVNTAAVVLQTDDSLDTELTRASALEFVLWTLAKYREQEFLAAACYRCLGILFVSLTVAKKDQLLNDNTLKRLYAEFRLGVSAAHERRIPVRVRAGWALANFWDFFAWCDRGNFKTFTDTNFLSTNVKLAVSIFFENEKCRANAVRGLGTLIEAVPVTDFDHCARGVVDEVMPKLLQTAESGPLKTRWNAAHAVCKILRHPLTYKGVTGTWPRTLLQLLPRLLLTNKNYKVKINAASALGAISLYDSSEPLLADPAVRQRLMFERLSFSAGGTGMSGVFAQLKVLLEALYNVHQECRSKRQSLETLTEKYKVQLAKEVSTAAFKLCHSARLLSLPPTDSEPLERPFSASMDVSFVLDTKSSRQTQDELLAIAQLWSLFQSQL